MTLLSCVFSQITLQLWQPKRDMQNFNGRGKYPYASSASSSARGVLMERALNTSPSWFCPWSSWQLVQRIFEGVTRICTLVCKNTFGSEMLQCAAKALYLHISMLGYLVSFALALSCCVDWKPFGKQREPMLQLLLRVEENICISASLSEPQQHKYTAHSLWHKKA